MKELFTTSGEKIIVDDEDFNTASEFMWQSYTCRKYNGFCWNVPAARVLVGKKAKTLLLHRLIMGAKFGDGRIIDHANGNTFDARKDNLRFCTHGQNISNQRSKTRMKTSKFHGVYLRNNGKWMAQVRCNSRKFQSKSFETQEEAAMAYNTLARQYHGEFASLNKL